MKKNFYTCLSCFLICSALSCTTIKKGQNFYSYKHLPNGTTTLKAYTNSEPVRATISETDGVVYFTDKKDGSGITESAKPVESRDDRQIAAEQSVTSPPSYYFSSGELVKDKIVTEDKDATLKYRELKLLVQPVATAFKYRLPTSNKGGVFEDGVKPAIGVNAQGSSVKILRRKNILGQSKRTLFANIGAFAGVGTIKLTPASTNNQVLVERSALIVPVGMNLMVGLNNINVGIAWGRDIPMGYQSGFWEYKKKNWIGLVFGLDILK